jgi:pimeloyl-ACP methyl ester carboxylesterase
MYFQLSAALVGATSPLNFDFPFEATDPVPFTATVNPEFVMQTAMKARWYRSSIDLLNNDVINQNWEEGPDETFMTDLARYWGEEYDWYKAEKEIFGNFSHYAVTIPDGGGDYEHPVSFHFVHEPSDNENAIPLLILHGWPSTHREWADVIRPLSHPEDGSQAFHVVAPDLPGFGFSPAPTYGGLGTRQMGAALDKLMKKLGYSRYALAGTDLGHFLSLFMGEVVPESIIGYYSDFWFVQPNATDLERYAQNQTTDQETRYIAGSQLFSATRYSLAPAHSISPLAIGQALSDSPVGFAGWMFHLMRLISDDYPYTQEEIVTYAMLAFIQGVYGNVRFYREIFLNVSPTSRETRDALKNPDFN